MRILFIGAVKSSQVFLEKLIEMKEDIVAVVTNEDKGLNSDYVDLSHICANNSIEMLKVDNINDQCVIEFIRNSYPDVIYCFGFSQLLGKEIISIPPKGVVGFHPSKLPQNRGRHPLIWAIALGLKDTGSTFFYINEGVDEGEIISQRKVPVLYEDDAMTLYDRVLRISLTQIEEFTEKLKTEKIISVKQELLMGNYWRKRKKADGKIDWRMSSYSIYNLVRALSHPYVGAHFIHENKEIKVWKVKEKQIKGLENIEPGKIIDITEEKTIIIKTGDNCIELLDYDPVKLKVGDYL